MSPPESALPSQPPVVQEIYDTQEIEIKAADACPRYAGRLIKGINPNAPLPAWLTSRLERCGLRTLSAPVMNFIMSAGSRSRCSQRFMASM